MQKRRLGRTEHRSTVVCFGTAALGRVEQPIADKAVEQILEHGVNHIDIAPTYGEAMERLAPWIPKIRQQMFIGAKTTKRSKQEAWEEIKSCMKRLGVESFDLFQLHAVTSIEELDKATVAGGALEALIEMRRQGLTKWVGITGHGPAAPKVQMEALRRYDFDTVMFPVSASIYRNPDYRRDAGELLRIAAAKDVGIHTIKMIARGGWGERTRRYRTWYDPHRTKVEIERALWWVLSQPIHTAPSAGDVRLLPKILDAAERFRPLDAQAQQGVLDRQHPPLPEPALGIPAAG